MVETTRSDRRKFLKTGALTGAALVAGAAGAPVQAAASLGRGVQRGDVAILRFLAAAEIIETDLWVQYAELGGVQTKEIPGLPTVGSPAYTAALKNLDGDMDQYISDNTEDELTHETFINAYLVSKGAQPVSLDAFRTLPSSKATGANQVGRLTNLMQLTVDTSWWTRYRSRTLNPDLLNPNFKFPQAFPSLASGKFPAIPRTDADLAPADHIQAIANTAAFHFAFIEQGGASLYMALAQRVVDPEVLRVVLSIGGVEIAHFQTWHDKAGNAVSDPLAPLTDSTNPKLVFPNLNATNPATLEDVQTNLIMPEACPFLSTKLPPVSIIRPTEPKGAATAFAQSLIDDGLFIGQSKKFFSVFLEMAQDADAAQRGGDQF